MLVELSICYIFLASFLMDISLKRKREMYLKISQVFKKVINKNKLTYFLLLDTIRMVNNKFYMES